jgi:hypothetical protein
MENKPYRGGRPRLSETERAKNTVKVRFTDDELNRLNQRMNGINIRDLSKFIRSVCLEKPLLIKHILTTHEERTLSLLREIRADLLRIGVNINQSVRRINGTTDYHTLRQEVDEMAAQLLRMEADMGQLTVLINQPNPNEPKHDRTNQ